VAIALFACVLVHELAHSLYALRKGGRVRDITLLMVGGVSQMSEPPKEVKHEAIMALAGPLVSFALGAEFHLLRLLADHASFNLRFALFYLGILNLALGAFNLLPAFPMDGGRILRAVLATRMGLVQATRTAAKVGKVFAVVFGVLGVLTINMLLVLIAFFMFIGAEGEVPRGGGEGVAGAVAPAGRDERGRCRPCCRLTSPSTRPPSGCSGSGA